LISPVRFLKRLYSRGVEFDPEPKTTWGSVWVILKELWIEAGTIPRRVFVRFSPSHRRKVEQILARKKQRELEGFEYASAPKVSLLLDSFNQLENIALLEGRLRETSAGELIVCDDGSIDGSADEWKRRLTRPNDFLIHSNDLHEIRILDRAIRMAKGEIVCIIQDDDQPPSGGEWLDKAVALFDAHPRMAVLGGWLGFTGFFKRVWNSSQGRGEGPIRLLDPATGIPFMFVDHVNIGPYFVRRSAYLELGDFDRRYSPVGVSGILFEAEYCYRAWLADFRVGLMDIPCGKWSAIGGTHLWGMEGRNKQGDLNMERLRRDYEEHEEAVTRMSEKANLELDQG
jgi:glycosyltransferase involved in cell wall biosynthesis